MSGTPHHHVKNKDLREQLIISKEKNELTPAALDMFILMAHKFSTKFTYIYEDDRKDCISFAIMDCYMYWRGYDPAKSENAFAYISQVLKNGFAKGWRRLTGNFPKSHKVSLSKGDIYSI
jgi:hypothetical protein